MLQEIIRRIVTFYNYIKSFFFPQEPEEITLDFVNHFENCNYHIMKETDEETGWYKFVF
jgi:hypothetical protein